MAKKVNADSQPPVVDDIQQQGVSGTSVDEKQPISPDSSQQQPEQADDDEDVEIEDFIEGYIVDSTTENTEEKYSQLQATANDLSQRKEAFKPVEVQGPYMNVTIDEGYAHRASVKNMDAENAVVRESELVRSYFLSDAFKLRAMRSLGYDSLDAMTPEHRKVYDDMVSRGKELAVNFRIGFIDRDLRDDVHSACVDDNGVTTVLINPEDKGLGMSILAHELGHHLYNEKYINPGIHSEEREYGGSERKYGTERSPLNTINETDVKERRARAVYEGFFQHLSQFAAQDDDMALKKYLDDYVKGDDIKLHDNAGMERAADVHGVRLLMMQEGIWNPFTGEPVTTKQIREFRKAHPDSRIFEYWNNKEAAYYLNNIAMSDKVKPDGVRLDCGVDGQYHLVASVGGADVDRVITQRDYDKLMALDDNKRGLLMSKILGGDGYSFDFSEGFPLGDLLVHEVQKESEGRSEQIRPEQQQGKRDYLALSSANFESISHDLDEGQQQELQRGMSV